MGFFLCTSSICYNILTNSQFTLKFMYTKQNLIDSVTNEFRIIKHLAEKIPVGTEGYKPTEGQRSTLELLQYLSMIVVNGTYVVSEGTTEAYKTAPLTGTDTTLANFAEKMDTQLAMWTEMVNSFDEEKINTVINVYGMGENTRGVYLVENILKWLAAYKTQLFLYLKGSGVSNIGTSNLWGGMDMIGGKKSYMLGGAFNDGKGQPAQSNAVSHGCPPSRFRNVNVINTGRQA